MESFGRYQVLEQVAAGRTGVVFKARDPEVGRLVAIKELSPALRHQPGMAEQLRAEARMLAALQSPHIVAVYEYVEDADRAWIAEEWVKGASLAALLASHGRLSPEQALGVMRDALTGLAYAHDSGLVHRDISSSNVLADVAGTSKLIDFGIAAPIGTGGAAGTPAFISPEAARGEAVGKTGDVYSAGALLFLLLTGAPVFPGADAAGVLRAHVEQEPPALRDHGARLADLIRRSLSKVPGERPPDARAFLAELEEGAKEKYGAAWLERAGIAGLVAATAGTVGAGAVTGGGGALAPAAETVVVAAASADTGQLPKQLAKSTSRVGVVVGVTAGVLVLAGAAAFAVTHRSSSNHSSTTAGSRTSRPTASPKLTDAQLTARVPTGVYDLTSTILSTEFSDQPVGSSTHSQWTLALVCSGGTCTGPVTSSSGVKYTATYDGTTLSVTSTGTQEQPCAEPGATPVPGDHGTIRYLLTGSLTAVPPDKLTGQLKLTDTAIAVTGNCTIGPPRHTVSELALTKVS